MTHPHPSNTKPELCGSGGIGRRAGFRILCLNRRGGSTPPFRMSFPLGHPSTEGAITEACTVERNVLLGGRELRHESPGGAPRGIRHIPSPSPCAATPPPSWVSRQARTGPILTSARGSPRPGLLTTTPTTPSSPAPQRPLRQSPAPNPALAAVALLRPADPEASAGLRPLPP